MVPAAWGLVWVGLGAQQTLGPANADPTWVHEWLNGVRDSIQLMAQDNWFFHGVLGTLADGLNAFVGLLQAHLSTVTPGDYLGWLGVVAVHV